MIVAVRENSALSFESSVTSAWLVAFLPRQLYGVETNVCFCYQIYMYSHSFRNASSFIVDLLMLSFSQLD